MRRPGVWIAILLIAVVALSIQIVRMRTDRTVGVRDKPGVAHAEPAAFRTEDGARDVLGTVDTVVGDEDNGTLTIRSGRTARAVWTKHWNLAEPTVTTSFRDGVFRVRSRCPNVPLNNCYVDIVITVPGPATVRALATNGSVAVEKMRGPTIGATTNNGSVRLVGVRAPNVKAESNNGNVTLESVRASSVTLETDNGSISAELGGLLRSIRLDTSNGDIDASVPGGSYDVDAETTNGAVRTSGVRDRAGASKRLTLHSTNGDITVTGR